MDMYNVLDTLKKIENPTEDQKAAIKSAEVTTPEAPAPQGVTEVSTTGDNIYAQYGKDAHDDLLRLAEVPVINVQSDTPETPANESVEIEEGQSPAQKAAFQKMLDAKKGKEEVEEEDATPDQYEKNEEVKEAKPDFLDLDKDGDKEEPMKKAAKDKEKMKEDETIEEETIEEAYDPEHVKSVVDKHEKEGHKVEMDRPEDGAQGFTVTFKDGSRRHYKYSKASTKVDSLEPTDPLVDPNAPKRERGRPKKEGLGEEQAEQAEPAVLDTAFVTMESEETDPLTAMFEEKLNESAETEEVAESLQVVQNIDDDNQETVSVNAQGEHTDMLKQLLNLSGQRSDGYKEYEGEEEAVEEERDIQHANTPHEQVTDVDTQLNKMAGGLNGPKDKSAAKSNSNALYNESITDEKMMELYKAYKGSE